MVSVKNAVMSDEKLLKAILKKGKNSSSVDLTALSLGISVNKICELLTENGYFHIYQRALMLYLHKNGVSHFDLVAKYGFDLAVLSKVFFQYEPEHYYGRSVNYLKITSHVVEDNKTFFICDCLACGSVNYKIRKHTAMNGLVKSCGCLPKGRRVADDLPIKNETLQVECFELIEKLIEAGVIFNVESKVIAHIKKGAKSAEKIAMDLNTDLEYVYKIARKRGYSEQINAYTVDNIHRANKEKVRKMLPAIRHGNAKMLCAEFKISQDTFRKYRKIIEDEKRSNASV